MKEQLKHQLFHWNLFPALDFGRRMPGITNWIRGGCSGIAPPPIKRMVLNAYMRKFGLTRFIETGTHLGDTLAFIARNKRHSCTSIELSDVFFEKANKRFASYPNAEILHGDSGVLLPNLVDQIETPCLFWLDGHWSGGITACADVETPISAELDAILESRIRDHVVLIDDARCFNGTAGYPHLDELICSVRERSDYTCEVSADIIRLTPQN
ncbi:hypothetical protein SH528x_005906 [Novipirellula sp. SH528]|uniref:hypothetical protein n=1 Tax=Novipirellula sp. SH528 TaxID=3454466 RepID=UPI003F9F036B